MRSVKAPLGIKPRALVLEDRALDVSLAMCRYYKVGCPVPDDWIDELTDINITLKTLKASK